MIGDLHPPLPKSDLTAAEADRLLAAMRRLEFLTRLARDGIPLSGLPGFCPHSLQFWACGECTTSQS
jgi:hypothetical protein